MIYELICDGYRLGLFPTEAEAVRRADYLPKGCYTLREWEKDGEFSTFDPSVNKSYDFTNYDRENNAEADINALADLIREYVAANCDGADEGLEVTHAGYMAFVEYRTKPGGGSVTVADVWDKDGNECPDIAEALQVLID